MAQVCREESVSVPYLQVGEYKHICEEKSIAEPATIVSDWLRRGFSQEQIERLVTLRNFHHLTAINVISYTLY